MLAVVATADARRAGADPQTLALAERELADGDQAALKGTPEPTIEHYRNAWNTQSPKGHPNLPSSNSED